MPTYEYECLECKHRFSVFQSIKDISIEECEKCGKDVRKIFGTAGIIFKGDGFYVNDYKDKRNKDKKEAGDSKQKSSKETPCSSCNACDAS